MGNLRKGFFTRGYKTSTEIVSLTEMEIGDTVFDTTWSVRKVYDGNNWVSSLQVSMISDGIPSGGGQGNGSCAAVSGTNDFRIQSGISTANDYNLIGAVQSPGGTVSIGDYTVLQYSGVGNIAAANVTINRGNFVDLSTTYGRASDPATPDTGTFGVWLSDGAALTVVKAFIRPIEMG